jgi:hypothetical protein
MAEAMETNRDTRSLGDLFAQFTREVTTLMRQEVRLAKAEVTQNASRMGRGAGLIAAGGAIAYAGFLALVATVILALALALPAWLAALIVGIVVAAIGGALAYAGLNALKHANMAPRQTMDSLQETATWAKEQMS